MKQDKDFDPFEDISSYESLDGQCPVNFHTTNLWRPKTRMQTDPFFAVLLGMNNKKLVNTKAGPTLHEY